MPYLDSATPDLPFTIRAVKSNKELLDVARLRLQTYRAQMDGSAEQYSSAIDANDYADNSVVIAAFEKATGAVIGTMRISFSTRGKPTMGHLVRLPGKWGCLPYGEARLLCIPKGPHSRMVLLLLCKAFFQVCRTEQLANIIIGARRSMEPFYRILRFEDLANPALYFQSPKASLPHRVLVLNVANLENIWSIDAMASLRRVFFDQFHSDIQISRESPIANPLSGLRPPVIDGLQVRINDGIVSLIR